MTNKAEQPTIESIVQDICELDNNPFDGMADDDVWLSLADLRVILERNFENTRTTSLAAQDGLVEAKELRRIAGIFKQWRSTLMLNKMDGEQWRSLNKAFDDLAALSAIKGEE